MSFYSPDYLASKMCKEAYSIARCREREEGSVIFPIYLRTADLPSGRRMVRYVDCREADQSKLAKATEVLLAALR